MATTKHGSYVQSIASALTTELNSLANAGTSSASASIDNTTNLDMFMDLEFYVAAQGSARSAGATVEVYLAMLLDGSTSADANATTAELIASFPLDAATTARRATRRDIPIPPGIFTVFAVNRTGQALASSGNTVKYRTHNVVTA